MKISRIFYGYWILLACFLLTFIASGCGPISFSFFVTSLETDFNWSRTEIMIGFMVFFVCAAIGSPLFGRLVHRYGARKVVSLGALLPCLGFILLSQMSELWHFYIGYILIGFGIAAIGPVIMTLIVSNWFVRHRGMAVGAMSMGLGTAGIIFTPLIIVYLLPNFGWSHTYLTLAAITGGIAIPLGTLVIRTKPADMGLLPDGRDPSQVDGIDESRDATSLTFRSAAGTLTFWLVAVAILFQSSHMGVMQNQVPYLEDIGFTAGIVALAVTILSIFSIVGPLLFGWLCDKIRIKFASIISLALATIGIILLMNVNAGSPVWFIGTYAITLGLGLTGWVPCLSLLVSSNFGLLSYGTIFGALNFFHMVGAGMAPIYCGYISDKTGSYEWAFIITAILIALAIPNVLAIRRPKKLPSSHR